MPLTLGTGQTTVRESGEVVRTSGGGVAASLFFATVLMILFRQRYPRWWFDFARELGSVRAPGSAPTVVLLTDEYPSTVDEQSVHLEIDYPDAERDLNRWLPLVKWFWRSRTTWCSSCCRWSRSSRSIIAWFAILFTGRYPRGLFDFVVGVGRWGCAWRPTRSCWSPTDTRPSRSRESDRCHLTEVLEGVGIRCPWHPLRRGGAKGWEPARQRMPQTRHLTLGDRAWVRVMP